MRHAVKSRKVWMFHRDIERWCKRKRFVRKFYREFDRMLQSRTKR